MRTPDTLLAPEGVPARLGVFGDRGAVLVWEEFGAGAMPLVLLHGIGMGRSVFRDLALRYGARIIAVDLPGFGEAPEPARTPTMADLADLVAAHLRDRDVPVSLVFGHSMGSQVAVELAARHPDLVGGLVLAGPTVDRRSRHVLTQGARLLIDLWDEDPRVLLRGAREYLRGGPHLARKIRATVSHRPEAAYAAVRCPALVIRGEKDPLAPLDWCLEIGLRIPNARTVEVPGQGHGTLLSEGEPIARLVRDFAVGL